MSAFLLGSWALIGGYLGLVNGIPAQDRRGCPTTATTPFACGGDKAAQRAIWAQLAINAAQTEGGAAERPARRLVRAAGRRRPRRPAEGARSGSAAITAWWTRGRYDEAVALRDTLLGGGAKLAAVHRYSLEADRAFFQIVNGEAAAGLAALEGGELKAFLRQMKSHPGIALVSWAGALAAGKADKAEKCPPRLRQSAGRLALRRGRRGHPGAAGLGRAEAGSAL